ncbi:MAG: hypothetical protein AAF318_12365 [Pseudomonadota bacterium]
MTSRLPVPTNNARHTLVLVSDDATFVEGARSSLSAVPDYAVIHMPVAEALRNGCTFDLSLLILDLGTGDPLRQDALLGFRRSVPNVPLLAVSDALPPDLMRRVVQLNPADWLQQPVPGRALLESVRKALSEGRAQTSEVVAFVSASGGAGATSLSVAAATALAAAAGEPDAVFLADLDFASGACGLYLDHEKDFDLTDLIRDPARVDLELLSLIKTDHDAGYDMLSVRDREVQVSDVSEALVGRLLDMVAYRYGQVLIDIPTYPTRWADGVLAHADHVVLVCERTVPSLKRACERARRLRERGRAPERLHVLVNKSPTGLLSTGVPTKDVIQLFDVEDVRFVPYERSLFQEALNRGEAAYSINAKAASMRRLTGLLDDLFAPRANPSGKTRDRRVLALPVGGQKALPS